MICLKSSVFMFPTFTQAKANMQCPFNKNIAFMDKGISWAFVVDIDVTANFLMNVCPCLIEIKWLLLPSCVCLCFRIYSGKQIKFSKFIQINCSLQYFSALLNPCKTCGCCPFFFTYGTSHFKDIKVCINGFSQFCYVPNEVRLFILLRNERFALGFGLWRLGRRSWAQYLAAEDGCNGNCGFPTL